ncbi:MAG TPA: aromatic amino acid ammonia-lyase [Sphingobium sp.]
MRLQKVKFVMAMALLLVTPVTAFSATPAAPVNYTPITYDAAGETVALTGHDLTIEQLVRIARHGAKVVLTPEARQRSADAYGLLLEAAAEGVSVYWFNRGAGDQRETVIFSGDPTSVENAPKIKARQMAVFGRNGFGSYPPEVDHEDVIRAMMAIRANAMSYEAASPQLTQMLLDLLNHGITPVVGSRGTLGEGDLVQMGDVASAMIGQGNVYYRGARMPAAQALKKAGLKPLEPFGADDTALISTNAYFTAHAALLVSDARDMLEWSDLATAMALVGMNSSLTPLSMPVQSNRPYPWLNWDAARVLDMVRGSYLLDDDPHRIIQDPESLRASTQRIGSTWQAWATMRDTVLVAMNSSDHNPAVLPNLKPTDSWELSSPQMMKFYVKGGPLSHGKSGYIFSNANWDPYPLANEVEAFTIAVANMGVVLTQRIERFANPFFTGVKATDVMTPDQITAMPFAGGYTPSDLWIEMTGLINPVTPQGQAIVATVEDLQAETRLKVTRARDAVELANQLLAQDLIASTNWMEVRKAQDPKRNLGAVPTAALAALRKELPLEKPKEPMVWPSAKTVYDFIMATPARSFYPGGPPQPPMVAVPIAQQH